MENKNLDKDNNIYLVLPKICRYFQFLEFFLKKFNKKVFYRGNFDEDLINPHLSDLFYIASEAYGKFANAFVRKEAVDQISKAFSLDSEVLEKVGKEALYKYIGGDFLYAFQVTKGGLGKRGQIIYPISTKKRMLLNIYLGAEPTSFIVDVFSAIGCFIEKIKLFTMLLAKVSYVGILIVYWRLTKPSKLARKVQGNFIWIPSGQIELCSDPQMLSLPQYLRQLSEFMQFKNKKFAVSCPFLKKERYWGDDASFAIPSFRNLKPGISNDLFLQGIKDLLKIWAYVPTFFLRDDVDLHLLNLLPEMILGKICLKKLDVKAVFMTDSCIGGANPLAHAARQINIPTILVCYSQSHRAVVLDARNQDIVSAFAQNIFVDYFCVWTEAIRKWFINAGQQKEKVFVAGPQMFAPVGFKKESKIVENCKIKIGLFSPTPLTKEFCVKLGYGGTTIFNIDYLLDFYKQSIDVMRKVFGSNFIVLFKIKRISSARDKDFVPDWEKIIKDVFLDLDVCVDWRNPNANPWMVLDDADIIVSLPFTSLSEAGFAMGKPASFFDPTGLIAHRLQDEVSLLSGKEELYKWLCNIKDQGIYPKSRSQENYGPQKLATVLKEIKAIKNFL